MSLMSQYTVICVSRFFHACILQSIFQFLYNLEFESLNLFMTLMSQYTDIEASQFLYICIPQFSCVSIYLSISL